MQTVYKVVRENDSITSVWCRAFPEKYEVGKRTKGKLGPLLAFDNIDDANKFMGYMLSWGFMTNDKFVIYSAIANGVSYPKMIMQELSTVNQSGVTDRMVARFWDVQNQLLAFPECADLVVKFLDSTGDFYALRTINTMIGYIMHEKSERVDIWKICNRCAYLMQHCRIHEDIKINLPPEGTIACKEIELIELVST